MRKTTFLIAILAMILSFPGRTWADEAEASKGKTESKDKGGKDKGGKGKDESKGKDKGGDKSKSEDKDKDKSTDKDWDPGKPILGEF